MRRVLALLALAALAACSSSSDDKRSAAPGTTTATSTSSAPSTSPTSGASPATSASAVPGASPGSSSSAGTTTTGGSPAPRATTGTSTTRSTAPGTYTYDSAGSQTVSGTKQPVDGTATLTVSEVIDGSQTSTLHNSQGDTEQGLVVRNNGSFLASLTISSPTVNKEFQFSPPALLLPDPAKVGAAWSWSGTSTDGTTKVSATNKVVRTEALTIGGKKVGTVVLQTHLVISGKSLSYTADATNWVAPAYRLPVKTHTKGQGKYGAFPFSFDVTDVMRSVTPA
jgi:hypothetical protein